MEDNQVETIKMEAIGGTVRSDIESNVVSKRSRISRKFVILFCVSSILIIPYLLISFYFFLPSFDIVNKYYKERIDVVIMSEFKIRNFDYIQKTLETNIEPLVYKDNGANCKGLSNGECRIKNLFFSALDKCDDNKTYCMVVEDDVFFLTSHIKLMLYLNTISWSNDAKYEFDCSKFGLFKKNYEPNGNGLTCRIYSKFLKGKIKDCIKTIDGPADVILHDCLKGEEEKRFLLIQTANKKSLRY
ncbi:hypothetical protein GQ42DRAFT_27699 [Ramicandelaber brevisporus]|nr:hypothetical protein GQ42DRAFT_27699 [Ramicandelaber brevisporus]